MGYGVAIPTRSSRHLSAEERETLSLRLARGHSLRTMVTVLRRAAYQACTAHTMALARAHQPRRPQLLDPYAVVRQDTPGSGLFARADYRTAPASVSCDMSTQLSVKTIYASLSMLSRGTLRSELLTALRQARTVRRPRARGTDRHGQIPHMTPIAERPAEVATHTVPGHWEGDRIKGARKGSAVEALVEGTTRLVIRLE